MHGHVAARFSQSLYRILLKHHHLKIMEASTMIRFLLIAVISLSSWATAKEEKSLVIGTWKSCGSTTHQILDDGSHLRIGSGSTVTFYKNGRYKLDILDGYTDLECKNLKFRFGLGSKGRYKILRKTEIKREEGPVYEIKLTGWYGEKSCTTYFIITERFILPADNLCTDVNEKNVRYRSDDWFKFYKVKKAPLEETKPKR